MTVERHNIFATVKVNEKWINPVNGVITSLNGSRKNPILKKDEVHEGIDIACPVGTQAVAVRSGTVLVTGKSSTYGNYLKYKTSDGYTIMYAHLKKAMVKAGDYVEQGQIIALTGNTGLSTGAHLHYGVWKDESLTDPLAFVNLAYTEEVEKEQLASNSKMPFKQ